MTCGCEPTRPAPTRYYNTLTHVHVTLVPAHPPTHHIVVRDVQEGALRQHLEHLPRDGHLGPVAGQVGGAQAAVGQRGGVDARVLGGTRTQFLWEHSYVPRMAHCVLLSASWGGHTYNVTGGAVWRAWYGGDVKYWDREQCTHAACAAVRY